MSKSEIGGVVDLLIKNLKARLEEKQLDVVITDSAKRFIIDNGYDEVYGARPIKRFIQANVETLLAKRIIRDNPKAGTVYTVDSDGKQLIIK